jgi:hypothetical protein
MSSLPDVGFRSDTLKSYFERVVLVAGPTWFKTIRELTFITDWDNHFGRTAVYCSAYFIAWWYGITILACGAFAAVLIASPEIRHNLFPNVSYTAPPGLELTVEHRLDQPQGE